ncbi:hypothetical protein DPMN_046484 [Dreissena polymorpha]|uniref:Uncharacterized protein n=1 Tax=Dreissena polymorpha TaxID=45954 RepID=A0A9D4I0K3_DREPO|nr:hypothetical protein DPMN_046484 [Dreissena polymorpha]
MAIWETIPVHSIKNKTTTTTTVLLTLADRVAPDHVAPIRWLVWGTFGVRFTHV